MSDTQVIDSPGKVPGDVPSLVEVVTYAFLPDGPVQRRMGQHRPFQAQSAIGFAGFAETQHDHERVRLFIQEQRAGIGKTLAAAVVLAFDAILNGHRGMVSVNTKALRYSYLQTLDDVSWIVRATLTELGCGHRYVPITMQERRSATQNISPSKIEALRKRLLNRTIVHTPQHDELIEYFDSAIAHGDEPTFDAYQYEFGGALPLGTTYDDWCMVAEDNGHPLWEAIRERNNGQIVAHITLVTHSMMMRNSISRGRVLNTSLIGDDEFPAPTGMLVIDEADKMPLVAFESQSPSTSLLTITKILETARRFYSEASSDTLSALDLALGQVEEGLLFFQEWNAGHSTIMPAVVVDRDEFVASEIIAHLTMVDAGLTNIKGIAYGHYNPRDRDILMVDIITRVQDILHALRNFKLFPIPKMSLRTFIDQDGVRDLEIRINLGLGRWLVNQYWRRYDGVQMHGFRGVIAVSATLADIPPYNNRYTWFRRHCGYDPEADLGLLVEKTPIPASSREPYGRISHVIVPEREGAPHPSNQDQENMIEPAFVRLVATGITAFSKRMEGRPETRMLVLFPSYKLIDAVYDKVPHLHDRLIVRQQGSNLLREIARYSATPRGIFFGVDWEGVNFVDPETHRTLVNFLVLTKIPQPPSDHIRISRIADSLVRNFHNEEAAAARRAFGISLREGSGHAYRKMAQGLGRGIRNASDVVEAALILDYRFPVPLHVAETRRILRYGGRSARLFGRFDSMFDPYGVQTWSKMELNGEIQQVYPIHQ